MSADESPEVFTVLVTGFEPFHNHPTNPSWDIARGLPNHLPRRRACAVPADSTSAAAAANAADKLPLVRIVVFPDSVPVAYEAVDHLVPKLWDGQPVERKPSSSSEVDSSSDPFIPPHIDLLLHIGMAGPSLRYSIERLGHREGYMIPDNDGRLPAVPTSDPTSPFHGVPSMLQTDVPLDAVLERWQTYYADVCREETRRKYMAQSKGDGPEDEPVTPQLRISTDAGRYLCEYTYFSSLSHLWRRKAGKVEGKEKNDDNRRRAVFLHVPSETKSEWIAKGRDIVVELVRALAVTELEARTNQGTDKGDQKEDKKEMVDTSLGADTVTGKWYRD